MQKGSWRTVDWVGYGLAAAVLSASAAAFFRPDLIVGPEPQEDETVVAPPPQVPGPAINRWKEAARTVEQPRGEPTGRSARVQVPPQLLHYADKRRFLAIQVAGWREQNYEIPADEAGLVRLIRRGEVVEVKPVTDEYVLYGVGANADDGPLTHFDPRSGREVTLYPRWDVFDDARAAMRATIEEKTAAVAGWRAQAAKLPRTRAARKQRSALAGQIRGAQAEIAGLKKRIAAETSAYESYDRRRMLADEWNVLQEQARAFGPHGYDLDRPNDRRAFRARLLSFIRPEALSVMEEIAKGYRTEFNRPLAFTSLIRSDHYQRELGETNANATRIAVPPHTTGLAFDIFYRYMTAREQQSIMAEIAGLESEGRVEALRENRDHYHVFAFANGRRPSERLIAEALGDVRPVRLASAEPAEVVDARNQVPATPAARTSLAARPAARKATVSPSRTAPRTTAVRRAAPRKTAAPRRRRP